MNDQLNEENFLQIWRSAQSNNTGILEYRLYYDNQGFPLFYSTEKKPGNYIVVSKDFYVNPPTHIRVVEEKIRVYEHTTIKKLVPGEYGQCCDPRDVCVIVDQKQHHTKWAFNQSENEKYYDVQN
jgi:hypothetical protein